jgi:hypothetical protein
MLTATPGNHDAALVVSATGCANTSVGLTGSVASGGSEAGSGGGGGCGHGAGGLLALVAPLLALGARRRHRS